MDLLVLGGGGFLGYHVATQALAAGHRVTTLSRSARAPVEEVEALAGDRSDGAPGLAALRGRSFDAVLDTSSDPAAVATSAQALSGAVGAYGYVSGMSVYAPDGPAVPDESAPVRRDGAHDDVLQERSIAKLAGEAAVHERFDGPVLVVRPGIMVGPRDPTDRFTWWPVRMARALAGTAPRTVLAPGDPDRPVQHTDARDLAAWVVRMLADRRPGAFNGVGPCRRETAGEVLAACLVAAGGAAGDVDLVWAGEAFLADAVADVEEEARPLWFPEPQIPQEAVDSSAAAAAGLVFRPVEATARDTLAHVRSEGRLEGLAAGLSAAREASVVAAWQVSAG